MTLALWGNITPLQMGMLCLAGYVLSRSEEEAVDVHTEEQRMASMQFGRNELRQITGEDFEYDLATWHQYLLISGLNYQHPYSWKLVKPAIEQAITDCERLRLVRLLKTAEETLGS